MLNQQQLEQALPTDLDVSAYAQHVEASDTSAGLEGQTLQQVENYIKAPLDAHTQVGHETSVDDVGTYSEASIEDKFVGLLRTDSIPMTRFGTMNYLAPDVHGGTQAINGVSDVATNPVVAVEPDGTLSALLPASNGQKVRFHYSYMTMKAQDYVNRSEFGNFIVTNDVFYYADWPDYTPVTLFGPNENIFLSYANNGTAQNDLFLSIHNGTLRSDDIRTYRLTLPSTVEQEVGYGAAFRGVAWSQMVGGSRYVYLFWLDKRVGEWVNSKPVFAMLRAPWPQDHEREITFEHIQNIETTRIGGSTVVGPYIEPYSALSGTSTTSRIRTNASVTSITFTNNSFDFIVIPKPDGTVIICCQLHARLNTASAASSGQIADPYIFDAEQNTFVPVFESSLEIETYAGHSIEQIVNLPDQFKGAYTLCTGRRGATVRFSDQYTFVVSLVRNSYGIIRTPGKNLLEFFEQGGPVNVSHRNIELGKGLTVIGALRTILPVDHTNAVVFSDGHYDDGQVAKLGNHSYVLTRHIDNDKSLLHPSSIWGDSSYYGPKALTPRTRPSTLRPNKYGRQVTVRRLDGRLGTYGSFISIGNEAPYRHLRMSSSTYALEDHNQIVDLTQIGSSLRTSVAQALDSPTDVEVEVFVPDPMYAADTALKPILIAVAYYGDTDTSVRSHVFNINLTTVNGSNLVATGFELGTIINNSVLYATNRIPRMPISYADPISHISQSVLHELENGFVLGINSSITISEPTAMRNPRFVLRFSNDTQTYSVRNVSLGHNSTLSYMWGTVPGAFGVVYNSGLMESGRKLLFRPVVKELGDLDTYNMNRYNMSESHLLFTIQPPASYTLSIPTPIPVMVSGEQEYLQPMVFNVHEVCEHSPIAEGRYFLYMVWGIRGSLEVVSNTALVSDTSVRTLIGHVDVDSNGISDFRLVKVSKVGTFRLTPVPYYGTQDKAILRSEGHPSTSATNVSNNVI